MSESLRNDGRVWVPLAQGRQARRQPRSRKASAIITWSASTPASATWCRATWLRATPSRCATNGRGVGETGLAVYLDFRDAIERLGKPVIKERYGNLFDMYERITGEDPYKAPMRIYPAIHYTMGGLWVDYNLMSTIPGLYVIGEANFSDHGANRLGASALMQGLADGYFVLPNTINDYLASNKLEKVDGSHAAVRDAEAGVAAITKRLLDAKGTRSVDSFHRELGKLMWEYCGMAPNRRGVEARAGGNPRAARAATGATSRCWARARS